MKLYIIGNGFDLNHGMKTAYWNYREFLAQNHSTIIREYENSPYFGHIITIVIQDGRI